MRRPASQRDLSAARTESSENRGAAGSRVRIEVELLEVPGLGGLFARGAVTSARLAVAARLGRAGDGELPDVTYLARRVRADADRLTAYQHLLGESASDVLPAGFVHVLAFPVATALMVRADFPLPPAGMVHLANAVEQVRPVSLGDAFDVRAHAQNLRAHRSGTRIDLVTEVRVGDAITDDEVLGEDAPARGELAWRGVSTYLARGVHLPAAAPSPSDDLPSDVSPSDVAYSDVSDPAGARAHPGSDTSRSSHDQPDVSDPAGARARPGSDTSGVGLPTGRWLLAGDVGRRYAEVSGDRNPIHLSPLAARALGFPRAIAHGMYTASRALATVGAARTDAFTWTVEFARPVLLPGTVSVRIAPDDAAAGFGYTGWDPRSGKLHFAGTVVPR